VNRVFRFKIPAGEHEVFSPAVRDQLIGKPFPLLWHPAAEFEAHGVLIADMIVIEATVIEKGKALSITAVEVKS
jgi:hypothetical protein